MEGEQENVDCCGSCYFHPIFDFWSECDKPSICWTHWSYRACCLCFGCHSPYKICKWIIVGRGQWVGNALRPILRRKATSHARNIPSKIMDHLSSCRNIFIALWFIPVIYSFVVSFSCQMYLQAQSKNMIIMYLAGLTLAIHIFLSWLLTIKYEFGISGAMISTLLAYWIPNIGQLIFVFSGRCSETWKGFSMLAFKDLMPVVKLSMSAGAMLCLEIWYNAILILLTGNLKNAEVEIDALSICLNISGWEMMIAVGFLGAASVRVANELGRGDAKAAKISILNIVLTSFSIGFVLFIFFLFFRGRLAYIFTKDGDVAAEVARLSPLLAISILLNSIQPVLSGVAIGAGWQSVVVYVNIGCYYLVGVPVGVLLGYVVKLQVQGVWIGMLIGTLIQTIILIIITYRTDWDKQVSIAHKRVNKWYIEDLTVA